MSGTIKRTREQILAECKEFRINPERRITKVFKLFYNNPERELGELREFLKALEHLPDDTLVEDTQEYDHKGIMVSWDVEKTDEELEKELAEKKEIKKSHEEMSLERRRQQYLSLKKEFEPTNK
jgi:hypothetical protein